MPENDSLTGPNLRGEDVAGKLEAVPPMKVASWLLTFPWHGFIT